MTTRRARRTWIPGPRDGPASPLQLPRSALWSAIRRSFVEFDSDNAWDWAAALTYYGVLSIFPGLLVVVAIVGLTRPAALEAHLASLSDVAPGPVRIILSEAVRALLDSPGQAGFFAIIGTLVGLWSASSYAAAFIRAANAAYDVPEGRPFWTKLSIRIGMTILTGVLLVASAIIVVVSGNLASVVGRLLGLESAALTAWSFGKWPLLVVLVSFLFAMLYWASPNARQGGFRWVSPGCTIAVLLWIAASAGFGLYAAHFATYERIYGTLAGVVVFLIWMWITNLALLLGLEIDAELERQRAIAAGLPRDTEPYMRLRDATAVPANGSPGLAGRSYQLDSISTEESDRLTVDTGRTRGSAALKACFVLGLAAWVAAATVRHRRLKSRSSETRAGSREPGS